MTIDYIFIPFLDKGSGLNRAALGQPCPGFLFMPYLPMGLFLFSKTVPLLPLFSAEGMADF
jgi:hypothetical protein